MKRELAVDIDPTRIDAIVRELDQGTRPGGAIGIAVAGMPVYRKGFGLANMELPILLGPTTKLRVGSISKHITCLMYLLLCEEGRASLDDPVAKYFPEFDLVSSDTTIRHLMCHISGLRDSFEFCWTFNGTGYLVRSWELLEMYRQIRDVASDPGERFSYNNGGYLHVSTAIERILNDRLEDILARRVFGPLGMHDTLLRRRDSDFVSNSADAPHDARRQDL